MAFNCTDSDHRKLQDFVRSVLDAHKSGRITTDRAVIIMSHVIVAAATDASIEFRTTIQLPLERYAMDTQHA